MGRVQRKAAEEARNEFSDLLSAAENGDSTIITVRGRAVAAVVPADQCEPVHPQQQSLVALRGSGRGMWGTDSTKAIAALRDEWER